MTIDAPIGPTGEDAPAVAIVREHSAWAGVFDGMGGAGGTLYEVDGIERTGAYIGARTAASAYRDWVDQTEWDAGQEGSLASSLRTAEAQALSEQYRKLCVPTSRLTSKLLKALPTTIAVAGVSAVEGARGVYRVITMWAGDSRIYVLTPDFGLAQLTRDHLTSGGDAQENLGDDSPMSNCASADSPFFLEELHLHVWTPFVIIAATDGCFGYVEAPVCFENLLLATMVSAENMESWESSLTAEIVQQTGDDASLAMLVVGWRDFTEVRAAFGARAVQAKAMVEQINIASRSVLHAKSELSRLEAERHRVINQSWEDYRRTYEPSFKTSRHGE
ncbi:hypothetical protein [Kribbella sp. NPDC051620]|uniref:hypothetical protein n=1 Tax=Kribbella sp. NPDC051620 TaxID=3364120 RepID=UPI00378A8BBD